MDRNKKQVYRSENLTIRLLEGDKELEFEIRFPASYTRGRCDATCPRCKNPVMPTRWEIEGPDGTGNTVWFECQRVLNDAEACSDDLRWTRSIVFEDWVENGG